MTLEYKPMPGDHIKNAAEKSIELSAKNDGADVKLSFNGCDLIVTANSTPNEIHKAYDAESRRKAEEYRNSSKGKLAAKARQEREDKKARENNDVDNKISGIRMEFSDHASWNKIKDANTDSYGAAAVRYAERWAKLMQAEMDAGKKLEDIFEETSFQADNEGITGFMHGVAGGILCETWKHGEALKKSRGNKAGM